MNQSNLIAISLVLIISSFGVRSAPTSDDSESTNRRAGRRILIDFFADSIKNLYDYLLQREYAEPLSLDHGIERKAVRSPSLRLRFGRRSDPDIPLIRRVCVCTQMRFHDRFPLLAANRSSLLLSDDNRKTKSIMKSSRSQ